MDIKNKTTKTWHLVTVFLLVITVSILCFGQTVIAADPPNTPKADAWITDGEVYAIAKDSDGTIYIGGAFSWVGPISGTGGVSRSNLAAFDSNGNIKDWNPGTDWAVYALAVSGNTVYIGGDFTTVTDPIAGDQSRNRIAAINSTNGNVLDWDPNLNQTVYAIVTDGSTVYAGGRFNMVGGISRNRGVVALGADGDVVSGWNAQFNGWEVDSLALNGSTLYVGGSFTNLGGQLRDNIAALNAANGSALAWNPGATESVYSIIATGTTVYIGGSFTWVAGQNVNYLAAIDTDGNLISGWNPSGTNEYETVNALAIVDYIIYAGGNFTNLGGANRNNLAAINTGGSATSWNPNADIPIAAVDNEVHALLANGSALYTGGDFHYVGTENRTHFAQFGDAPVTEQAPNAPSNIATSSVTTSSINITWSDNSSDETGFVVDQSTDGLTYTNVTLTAANTTSLEIGSLSENTQYWFRVAARNDTGDSAYSTISSGTYTSTTPVTPATPAASPIGTSIARKIANIIEQTLPRQGLNISTPPNNSNTNKELVTTSEEKNKPEIVIASTGNSDSSSKLQDSNKNLNQDSNSPHQEVIQNQNVSGSNLKYETFQSKQNQLLNLAEKFYGSMNFVSGILALFLALIVLVSQFLLLYGIPSLLDFWSYLLRYMFFLLTLFGLRSRRRYWGTVYDSVNKQPIDPAIVELIDYDSGKVLERSVTDLSGRFGFLDKQGRYRIEAKKTHYTFPSRLVTGTIDSIFNNVYHGELIEISKPDELLVPNIPMDQLAFDWNQMEKQKTIKFHPNLEIAIQTGLNILFWIGFVFVLLNFATHPNFVYGIFALLYVLFVILKKFILGKKLWGEITSHNINTSGLLLEISFKQIPQVVVARAVTTKGGKFFLKTSKGEYILKIRENKNFDSAVIFQSEVYVGRDGVINDTIKI